MYIFYFLLFHYIKVMDNILDLSNSFLQHVSLADINTIDLFSMIILNLGIIHHFHTLIKF